MAKNTPKSIKSRAMKPQEANSRRKTKKQTCIDMLMRPKGNQPGRAEKGNQLAAAQRAGVFVRHREKDAGRRAGDTYR